MVKRDEEAAPNWTVAELLKWTEEFFRKRGIPTPRLDAELLLASVLGGGRIRLYTEFEKPVDPAERKRYRELVERRAKREPVAYLAGTKEFYSLRFSVTPAVLIPRPETEHLVDEAVEALRSLEDGDRLARILDLGTGSGNVAVAIAANCPHAYVTSVDVSEDALRLARRNAVDNEVGERVTLRHGDLFEALRAEDRRERFDLIVSNPPYVARSEMASLMDDVRLFEPELALLDAKSAEQDGLGFYRAIASRAKEHLRPGGAVLVEVGDDQCERVAGIFSELGLSRTRTVRDYSGINRVVCASSA